MRTSWIPALCMALAVAAEPDLASASGSGGCVGDFCHSVVRDFKRNNCWPEPFVCPDRQAVRSPFVTQVGKGWDRQNTLGPFYFDEGGRELTQAAKSRIRWILTETPEQHRTIYVYQSVDPAETALRLKAVDEYVHEIAPEGEPPQVLQTAVSQNGWPADRVDAISRKFYQAIPVPKLPQAGAAGGAAIQ